jgi:hypothetical protein
VCNGSELTVLASSTTKVRPPSPGTPEYEQLEPITFAKSVLCLLFILHMYDLTGRDYASRKQGTVGTSNASAKR